MPIPTPIADTLNEAAGKRHRADPVIGSSGGPAGNARLTAWTGLLLLVLILAELVTVLDVRGLISWHIVVGTLLVPVALLKTTSTSWRVIRYYTGHRPYQVAGPPPAPLRLLGPLVVITTLGLLGSGLALIALGPDSGRRPFLTVLGFSLDTLTVHKALFIAFMVVTGLHLLARLVPAVTLVSGRVHRVTSVPGGSRRVATLSLVLIAAAITATLVLGASGAWKQDRGFRHDRTGLGATTQQGPLR